MEKQDLTDYFAGTQLAKKDLARYLITDPAVISRALRDASVLSDFQKAQARSFFSVVPDGADPKLVQAVRSLRSPTVRERVISALADFLVGHGVRAEEGEHAVDRCIRRQPMRIDQIVALARCLDIPLLDLTRSTDPRVTSAGYRPRDRSDLLARIETAAKSWVPEGVSPYHIEHGRTAEPLRERETAERADDRHRPIEATELEPVPPPAAEEADAAFVVLSDACLPKFEVMELLLVRWHTATLTGRWALVLTGKTSGYIGRVVADHESTIVIVQSDGSRHRLSRSRDLKVGVIIGTRLP